MPPVYQETLERLKTSNDRKEIAIAMVELAEHAERSSILREILKKTKLRYPFDNFEYVKCPGRKGYWRRSPANREFPTVAQAEFRLAASKVNSSIYGMKGMVDRLDGTQVPLRDIVAGEMLRGTKFTSDKVKEERKKERTIERLTREEPY
ncbi:MAG: hypothetical protein PHZ02_01325 [Desulfocapsaceae bacterium]|nr:hypothetical protein [Desulfocapsaceae bacterium]